MGKIKKTFKTFYDDVSSLAYGLKETGVKKGDKVAILLNNSVEFVISYFAILALGGVVVPLNTFLRQDEIIYILNDCMAKILITSSDFESTLKDFNFNKVQSLENIISVDKLNNIKNIGYDVVFKKGKLNIPFIDIDEEETAVLIYTSGTTGFPKGAMLSHKNLISNVKSSIKAIHINENDRFIIFLPMFHAFSFTVCVLIPLYCQCNLTIIKSIQPFSKILKSIFFDRISIFVAIPQVYNVLSNKKIPGWLLWLNPVRVCISGAAPLAGEILRRFEERFKVPLMEGYGLSEASPVVSVNPLDGIRKPGSVGPPIPGVEVKIADEDGNFLEPGQVGEIVVKGPNIMKGYYNRDIETNMAIRDGWLYTGDIGKIDEDGYLYIIDRKKDLIIVNGMNLYPREVEEVLYKHPAIQGAVVVGKKDEMHGEIPIGVILLKEGMSATEQELKKFCKQHLANYKIPHRFEFWKELPMTGTGKILKREVKRIINER
jgi:long-chain acyl-CoA synthetase